MFLAACTRSPAPAPGHAVDVSLRDFRITPSRHAATSGVLTFRIQNHAPATHEFVVFRTDLPPARLPIGSDGLSVDESVLRDVAEISEVQSGTSETLSVALRPGHYVLICNLEGHYLGGMQGALDVTGEGPTGG